MLSVTQGFFAGRCLSRMLLAVSVTACFNAVDQGIYFGVLIFKDEQWSKLSFYRCSKNSCDVGVLEFLQTEPDSNVALVFDPLEAVSEGHHYKFMVISNIGSGKAPGLCNVLT